MFSVYILPWCALIISILIAVFIIIVAYKTKEPTLLLFLIFIILMGAFCFPTHLKDVKFYSQETEIRAGTPELGTRTDYFMVYRIGDNYYWSDISEDNYNKRKDMT